MKIWVILEVREENEVKNIDRVNDLSKNEIY